MKLLLTCLICTMIGQIPERIPCIFVPDSRLVIIYGTVDDDVALTCDIAKDARKRNVYELSSVDMNTERSRKAGHSAYCFVSLLRSTRNVFRDHGISIEEFN